MYKNLAAAGIAAGLLFSTFPSTAQKNEPLKVGFVYVAPVTDAGWVHQHEEARLAVQAAFDGRVKTDYVENVPEGPDAERVIRDLASTGHKLIFASSFGYMEPMLKVAREFPDVKFESITGYKTAANVAAANARYYEGRYLSGIAAGRMTKSNVAGYVAGFPIPEVLQGINAFTLGMRSVNPKAQVKVVWINAWFDPAKEREAALTLMNQGADVLSFHTASTAVMQAAQERGKLAIAYHSDMRKTAPDAQLMAVTHQWADYYKKRTQAVLDGTWKPVNVWGGVKEGMIRVGWFGPKVPKAVQAEVLKRQDDIGAGRLRPFVGPIVDNEGHEVLAKGQAMTDDQILNMKFLVSGVQGKIAQ
ncbi:BMP family ABC transporter substrate-binding protein [Ramlibacter sp. G-1-2-2]|uniref:BMP family ABC transporter substrate-binding protein n=1 Tax=Ramlibacter agri TaxID=2728837 RepID=A0A848H3C3_9BURK|nr:BMP family ABC transporter substrate-binding protein [Ramlibacter agri]NML43680.1 BMP family ABC transporter substrate-binding protein [Ramlibacter agri]